MIEYKQIQGFPNYIAGTNGTVLNKKTGRTLKAQRLKSGYKIVCLRRNGKSECKYVHRLIAEAFIPNNEKKREVDHKNRDRGDNRVCNLHWVSHKENHLNPETIEYRNSEKFVSAAREWMKSAWKNKRWKAGRREKKIVCTTTGVQYESTVQASAETGAKQGNISACCTGRIRQTKGLKFSFV